MTAPPPNAFPVWANGRLQAAGTPVIDAEDQGFLLGLAVFDTLLHEDGCLYFVEDHVARLARGAGELAIPWPPPWPAEGALRETAAALGGRDAAVRITLSRGVPGRGPTLVVTARDVDVPPAAGVRVLVSSHRKAASNELEALKSTNRLRNVLAREEAQAAGAWEALFANEEGDLSEATVSNLFVVSGGALLTPPVERGCLSGVVREKVLSACGAAPLVVEGEPVPLRVERVEPEHVFAASEVFLTNTTGRVIPVVEVAGLARTVRGLPGSGGPVAREVRARLAELERAYRAAERAAGKTESPGGVPSPGTGARR